MKRFPSIATLLCLAAFTCAAPALALPRAAQQRDAGHAAKTDSASAGAAARPKAAPAADQGSVEAPAPADSAAAGSAPAKRPVLALSLSGGGARGLAHIGVLKVLEEEGIHIDIVTGNSMGALLGGLYAAGYNSSQLEQMAVETDWLDLFEDKSERKYVSIENKDRVARYALRLRIDGFRGRPLAGLLSGRKIYSLLSRMTWPANTVQDFSDLPRPFRCVATDISTGDCVVLDRGSLADAMRASMAIPGVFEPFMIDGRMLVDGMLVRNFPAEDAREMGADIVIGSDVGSEPIKQENIKSLFDIVNQSVILAHLAERKKQLSYADLLITPDVQEFGSLDFQDAASIIKAGEKAARAKETEIRALARSLNKWQAPPPPPPVDMNEAIEICDLRISGTERITRNYFIRSLGIELPAAITCDQLEETINRLYGMGWFKLIRYRFDRSSGCTVLDVSFEEDRDDCLRLGLRYDSYWGTALLLDASLKELFSRHSDLETDLMLGDRFRTTSRYNISRGLINRVGIRTDFDWLEDVLQTYSGGERTGKLDVWEVRAGVFADYAFSRYLYWDIGAVTEWARSTPQIVAPGLSEQWTRINMVVNDLWFDSLDRSWFPQKGIMLRVRAEAAGFGRINTHAFNRVSGKLIVRVPMSPRLTLGGRMLFGLTDRSGIPAHYRFFVGGVNSSLTFQGDRNVNFYGLDHQELSGRHAYVIGLDAQYKVTSTLYLIAHFNTGDAEDVFKDLLSSDSQVVGVGLTAGYSTPLGPLELSTAVSDREKIKAFLSAGYRF